MDLYNQEYDIVLHHICPDGHVSATIFYLYFLTHGYNMDLIKFIPGYNNQTNNIDVNKFVGHHVIFIDYIYDVEVLKEIQKVAKSMLILDHHKTNQEKLENFGSKLNCFIKNHFETPDTRVLFDMSRCGSTIAWNFLFPEEPTPDFIKYIQDRDLFQNKLPNIEYFVRGFASLKNVETFNFKNTIEWIQDPNSVKKLVEIGEPLYHKYKQEVEDFIKKAYKSTIKIKDANENDVVYDCMVVEAHPIYSTDVGTAISSDKVVGATFFKNQEGKYAVSLRSKGNLDVRKIAEFFKGGGHTNASGFSVEHNIFVQEPEPGFVVVPRG